MTPFDKISFEEQLKYYQMARDELYPGLEPAWNEHDKLMSLLARTFYKVGQLKLKGVKS